MAEEECPMERFCKLVGSRWGCLIVKNLMNNDELGFNELLRQLSTNPKTLSDKLKLLEKNGLVKRRVVNEMPIRVFYSLTEKGRGAARVEEFISKWIKG